jgi:hypothetical protein
VVLEYPWLWFLTLQKHSVRKFGPTSQVVKPERKRGLAQTFELSASEELKTIAMDTLGPLDPDSKGYSHVIALTDEFSRYTELTAIKSTSAAEAANIRLLLYLRHPKTLEV